MENFGVIIWGIVIISWIAKFIGRLSSKDKDNDKRKGVEKKIADFFSDNTQAEQEKTKATKQSMHNSKQSMDDKWIPAYEESPGNDDRPLKQAANMDNSRNNIKRQVSRDESNINRQNIGHKIDEDSSIRAGSSVYRKPNKNSLPVNNKKDRDDAYRQDNKKRKSYFDVDSFSSDDLIKGVIFKEILDQPRAKRPYKPFDRKR